MADLIDSSTTRKYYIFNSLPERDYALASLQNNKPDLNLDELKNNCATNGLMLTVDQEQIIVDVGIKHHQIQNPRLTIKALQATDPNRWT